MCNAGGIDVMKRLNTILVLLALAAISIFALGGCSSDDGVTPHDEQQLTAEDSAYQAGFVTMVMGQVLQEMAAKADPVLVNVSRDHVYGSYWDDGDQDRVWTEGGNILYVDLDGLPHDTMDDSPVTFDINAANPGFANGSGSVDFPPSVTFTIVNVALDPGNFPIGGQVLVDTTGHTATITFFPGHTAQVEVDGDTWDVDMDTGELTPA